jgi:CDP-6-deoxy-D-xylo-4-hexulose-3-dehydrase
MEGGMIVTDDEETFNIILSLRAHGWTRNLPDKNLIHKKSSNEFHEQFKFILPGYNVRPLEMSGAIGLEQLIKLPNFITNRRDNAEFFIERFKNNNTVMIQKEIGKSSWFGFSLIIKDTSNINRDSIIKKLNKKGIETRPIVTGNFLKNPTIKYYDYEVHNNVDNSDFLDKNGFFVGNHHYPMKEQIEYLFSILGSIK